MSIEELENTVKISTTENPYYKFDDISCNIPNIVQSEDSFFQSEIYKNMSGGHPTAVAYSGMANDYERLLNECIIENQDYFFDTYRYDWRVAKI